MMKLSLYLVLIITTFSCSASQKDEVKATQPELAKAVTEKLDTAYFASGCFWCTEAVFERVQGVYDVVSGYAGGTKKNPTYQEVSYGRTDYAEAVRVAYNPDEVSYEKLIEFFYASHDPTQLNRQGPDVGKQYRSEIYYQIESEKEAAEKRKKYLDESGKYNKPIVTLITPFSTFYEAEDYHQNYYELHPDQSYVASVSKPKVEKFMREYKKYLKDRYQ